MMAQPRGWSLCLEIDFPCALPSDPNWFKKHKMQKRDILFQLEKTFTQ